LTRDDSYTPTDIDALRMENELLTFEVRFLKAQLSARVEHMVEERVAEYERSLAQLNSRLEASERRLAESEHRSAESLEASERRLAESEHRSAESSRRLAESERRLEESERSVAQLRERLAEAEGAEQDLVLLLRRMANSPLGWFFGLKQNFRILEQRYLGTDA
jgi:septal ring factor EnvC (AmiA/AmiB activator)